MKNKTKQKKQPKEKATNQFEEQLRKHPDYPVVEKSFRIQKEVSEQMRSIICPDRSEEELMDEFCSGKVLADKSLWCKIREWAHSVAFVRLTQAEQKRYRRYMEETRPIRFRNYWTPSKFGGLNHDRPRTI